LDQFKNEVIKLLEKGLAHKYGETDFYKDILAKLRKNKPYFKHPLKHRLKTYFNELKLDVSNIDKRISIDIIVEMRDALAHSLHYKDINALSRARRTLRVIMHMVLLRELNISENEQKRLRVSRF